MEDTVKVKLVEVTQVPKAKRKRINYRVILDKFMESDMRAAEVELNGKDVYHACAGLKRLIFMDDIADKVNVCVRDKKLLLIKRED